MEILGFLDSDSEKWGKEVPFATQYSIMGIDDIKENYDYIIVASVYAEIVINLLTIGIEQEKIILTSEIAYNKLMGAIRKKRSTVLEKILRTSAMKYFPYVENICPLGTHGSPINDLKYVKEHENEIFKDKLSAELGIVIDYNQMLETFREFCNLGQIFEFPFYQQKDRRYFGDNNMFGMGNAHILSHILMKFKSKQIIEVGSGFSSASM